MQDWNEAAQHYRDRLEQALSVKRHALELARFPEVDAPEEAKETIRELSEPLENQLERLERGEFRIAVVGLEKAGKSTLVNAWLEHELLPTKSERCTFTTTQIESVTDDSRQRAEVTTYSKSGFESLLDSLRETKEQGSGDEASRAAEDLETIQQHETKLLDLVGDDPDPLEFAELEDISEQLTKYIADERYAHAVKEVRVYTSRLASADGVVFFDVPGLNSGLQKHIDASREMLADCDAVVCIQQLREPSLEASEKKLVKFIREGDVVDVHDKLFVFLGQADIANTAQKLREDRESAKEQWRDIGDMPSDKIVTGSAGAYLVLEGLASAETLKAVGDREEAADKIETIFELDDPSDDDLVEATGIDELRNRVDDYLRHERVDVLKRRCEPSINDILDAASTIYEESKEDFPENPEALEKKAEKRQNIRFEQWWKNKWQEIQSELKSYFDSRFEEGGEEDGDEPELHESVEELRERYVALVEEGLASLPHRREAKREEFFDSLQVKNATTHQTINDQWRDELYEEVTDMIEDLSEQLAMEMLEDARELTGKFQDLLFDEETVERRILDNPDRYQDELELGFRTLFLRFARPMAKVLVQSPKGSQNRSDLRRELRKDLDLLDPFYEGEKEYERLKRFAKYGKQLLDDPFVRQVLLKIEPPASIASEIADRMDELEHPDDPPEVEKASNLEEVVEEVEADLDGVEEYFKGAVFEAAGFAEFHSQELQRLRDEFVDKEETWRGITRSAWKHGNEQLMRELPPELRDREVDTEICERVRQLGIAIRNAQTSTTELAAE